MPKVAKNATPATYDRTHLESLSRAQVQALAKAHNVKANGKTANIIEQLLLKQEAIESGLQPEGAVASNSMAAQKQSFNGIGDHQSLLQEDASKETVSVKIEPEAPRRAPSSSSQTSATLPQTPQRTLRSSRLQRTPSASPHTPPNVVGFQEGRHPSRSTPYRRATPYPRKKSGSGSIQLRDSESPTSRRAMQALIPVMEPADKDVRAMRRKLAGWVPEQAAEQDQLKKTRALVQYTEKFCEARQVEVNQMAFKSELVETMVLAQLKNDRFLWDGTATMKNPAYKSKWVDFVQDKWLPIKEGTRQWREGTIRRGKLERRAERQRRREAGEEDVESDTDGSNSTANSMDEDGDQTVLVDDDEDANDDMYAST